MPRHCYYRLTLTRRCDLLSSFYFEDLKSWAAWDEGIEDEVDSRGLPPQTSYGRTHKRTAKHDRTQTMTAPSQEAWVKLPFPLCVFKNPQMTITKDLINWEGGVDGPAFSQTAGESSFTSCHLYGQRKAGGVPLLLSWGLGPDFKRCSPA